MIKTQLWNRIDILNQSKVNSIQDGDGLKVEKNFF